MASSTVEERNEKVLELKSFVKSVEEKMKMITEKLSWSYQKLCEDDQFSLAICSVHPEHRTSHFSISSHEEKCKWLQEGYHKDDLPLPEYSGQGSCVFFTPDLHEQVIQQSSCEDNQALKSGSKIRSIPQTSARYDQEFTQKEKLAIYDYVIAHTKSQKLFMNNTLITQPSTQEKTEEKVMTPLEIAAAERDAKRRRASYRNKVHTNRKTLTEIMREVIQTQMEELKELSVQNEKSKEKDFQQRENNADSNSKCHVRKSKYTRREHSNVHSQDKSEFQLHKNHDHHSSKRNWKYKSERESKHKKHKKSKKHKRSHSRSKSREKSNRYK